MADQNIPQEEADALLAMEKHCVEDVEYSYPVAGSKIAVPLISADEKEQFVLDVHRGRIDLTKGTYQNRAHNVVILARLDFGSRPHRNPDGEEIGAPHIHIYKEDYGDSWAYPLDTKKFSQQTEPEALLRDFMDFCNITQPPVFRGGLFS